MTTWSFKGTACAIALSALAGCDAFPTEGLLAGASRDTALRQVSMAGGAVTLVPPAGFCIDGSRQRRGFALMARCDVLSEGADPGGAPLGVITVSVTPAGETLPTPAQTADAARLARFSAAQPGEDSITFRAEGTPPVAELDVRHWRGVARVGDHLIGVSLFGPKDGRATSAEGRGILKALIARTRAASAR